MKLPKLAKYPKVSLCTPTFNRRPFYPYLIKCIEQQDYPKDKIEWIIIDDGTDKIEDLVSHLPYAKYHKYDEKMTLGKKRNLMHEKSKGDIIIYIDDDDYYPPERISHAVKTLQDNPKIAIAGSSVLFIYFKHISQMYKFGPYAPYHSTAATFAFRKELLTQTKYDETASLAEEKLFLKDYTIPLAQLDPLKSILVFSHIQNTFDKKKLLVDAPNQFVRPSDVKIEDIMKGQDEIRNFYTRDIDTILENYKPGDVTNKPDVLKHITRINDERHKMMLEQHEQAQKAFQQKVLMEKMYADFEEMKRQQVTENKPPVVLSKTETMDNVKKPVKKEKPVDVPVIVTAEQIKESDAAAERFLKELEEEESKKKKPNQNNKNNKKGKK
jgi:glycosyltransferase involved in cell wall biosynthesis